MLLFVPAVFLAALLFDRGFGYLATVLSAVIATWIFIAPKWSVTIGANQWLPLPLRRDRLRNYSSYREPQAAPSAQFDWRGDQASLEKGCRVDVRLR
ncbi:DUF4118 domain-containing protein [Rhizobium leguminosarum]